MTTRDQLASWAPKARPTGRRVRREVPVGAAGAAALLTTLAVALAATLMPGRAEAADPARADEPVPAAAFFRPAELSRPVLSPNGERLAVHVTAADGRQRLAVLSVAPPRKARIIAGLSDADVGDVRWVNDDRLVFDITDKGAAWADRHDPGLFAVGADGSDLRGLIRRRWDAERTGMAISACRQEAARQRQPGRSGRMRLFTLAGGDRVHRPPA